MPSEVNGVLVEKFVIPLLVALIGWFVKDYLFAVYARREEMARKEWERRLIETWSPLYYWSGVILFDDKARGWDRHGVQQLEVVLARSANLIPASHYATLVKLLQTATEQQTTAPSIRDVQTTRRYVYKQIEILNYFLYRRAGWFELTTYTHFFSGFKWLLRFVSYALKHMLVWLLLASFVGLLYFLYQKERYWLLFIFAAFLSLPVAYDWYTQFRLHRQVSKVVRNDM